MLFQSREARDGAVVTALASHSGFTSGVDAICGLSLLLVLSLAPRGFSPGTPFFPSPQKPTFQNSNSTINQVDEEHFVDVLLSKSFLFIYNLFVYQQPTHATYLQIPESKASFLIGFLSVGSLFGRLFFGHISDLRWVNRMYLYQTALLVMAVTTTLCPLATTYYWLVVYTLLFGIFDGAFVSLIAVLTGDVVGHHRLSSALGFLYLVFSVPIMTGSLIAGMISSNKMANGSHIN